MVLGTITKALRTAIEDRRLPDAARAEQRRDERSPLSADPGLDVAVEAAFRWLAIAQDRSASADGGVARHFSLVSGWAPSYPETTGYIVPTMLEHGISAGDRGAEQRGARMLDWLASIQLPDGAFAGGMIGQQPVAPTTFNTGQILIGLSAGTRVFGERYREPMRRAADWLVRTQDPDGCWRKNASPFARAGEKTYDTHVAWGLLEAARVADSAEYAAAALRNASWALTKQQPNGWFADNCLNDPVHPLTHTIGYAMRGVLEAYLFSRDERFLDGARRCADGALTALRPDGALPGRLSADWSPAVDWVCLTGAVQIAHCWLLLYRELGDVRYRDAGFRANAFVRRTVRVTGDANVVGGVKGSWPVSGGYGRFEFLNWACKFFIDSNLLERDIRRSDASARQ